MTPVLVALALLLGQTASAFAGYDARKSEAEKALAVAEMPEEEREELEDALDAYFAARKQCLEALVKIVENDDEDPLADLFSARAVACASKGSEPFDDALDGFDPPSVGALGFVNVFQKEEAPFMGGLAGLSVAADRDEIVAQEWVLRGKASDLQKVWTEQTKLDDSIDVRAKRETEELKKLLEQTIRRAAEIHKDTAEKLREVVKKGASTPTPVDLDPSIAAVKAAIGLGVRLWEKFDDRVKKREAVYERLFDSEARVMIMFNEVRDEVEEFLEENGYPQAEAAHERAEDSLGDFVSDTETTGQRSDAVSFKSDIMKVLDAHLKETQEVYAVFVAANEEKFFGAVGPDVIDMFAEPDAWGRDLGRLRGFALDRKLRAYKDEATHYFGVDLSGLTRDQYEDVTNGLRGVIDELARELNASGRSWRDVYEVIEQERKKLKNELR